MQEREASREIEVRGDPRPTAVSGVSFKGSSGNLARTLDRAGDGAADNRTDTDK